MECALGPTCLAQPCCRLIQFPYLPLDKAEVTNMGVRGVWRVYISKVRDCALGPVDGAGGEAVNAVGQGVALAGVGVAAGKDDRLQGAVQLGQRDLFRIFLHCRLKGLGFRV